MLDSTGKHAKADDEQVDECPDCDGDGFCPDGCCDCPTCTNQKGLW